MATIIRRNSSFTEPRRIDATLFADREASFHNQAVRWPDSLPSAESMAEAGFHFTPNDKNSDCCTCFRCGIKMFNWLPDDTAKVEHKKFSPSCKEVKTWTGVPIPENDRAINRAEQTDSGLRFKLKKFTNAFHRKPEIRRSTSATGKEFGAEAPQSMTSDGRVINDDEKLANIRRKREIAEKSLDGLQKLSSFYPAGSTEQKRAEQSILLQSADLAKLCEEERLLSESMGSLSFGRGWKDVTNVSPVQGRGRSHTAPCRSFSDESPDQPRLRPLPMLPSQMRSGPKVPAKLQRSQELDAVTPEMFSSEAPQSTDYTYAHQEFITEPVKESDWIEYFTDDNTPYYYNLITKETVWEVPEQSSTSQPVA